MGFWGESSNARVINTDGDPGTTVFVGMTQPEDMDPAPDLQVGDVWVRMPTVVYPAVVATVSTVPAVTVTTV